MEGFIKVFEISKEATALVNFWWKFVPENSLKLCPIV